MLAAHPERASFGLELVSLDVLFRRRRKLFEKMNDPQLSANTRAAARRFFEDNEEQIAIRVGA